MSTQTPTLLLDARDMVGESLVYDERRDALVWVDLVGCRIHRLTLRDGAHEVWPTGSELATSIGLRQDGGAVVGLTHRVALWDFVGEFRTLAVPEPDLPDNRLNEGVVAPDGSFWVGTMENNVGEDGEAKAMSGRSGAVYRVSPDGSVARLTPADYGITNTMAWTDGRFLLADTLANTIYTFDHDSAAAALTNRRIFASGFSRGLPDGSCLDAEGYLWNCRVGGGSCLARFAPDGSLDRIVDLPCSWPTSCCFGGEDFGTLYVTSARFTMNSGHLDANPQEGGLFGLDLGIRGRPEHRFG